MPAEFRSSTMERWAASSASARCAAESFSLYGMAA
jgi:hypothetical protein